MFLWLLPTFLWTGKALDEDDRPLQKLFHPLDDSNLKWNYNQIHPHKMRKIKYRYPTERFLPGSKAVKTNNTFINLYNKLLCPQCVANTGVIAANGVSTFQLI